ncbi:AAA family ATPase [Mycobacterium fragae]|uniref:Cyclase n=1 Tax=Mycobacterium fragae TaxID=1260918 RepID=A0A1X1UJS9_9MYCO|nr:adenylate/guanylate cyclase domain-containing protein [Mycobacterium fragae]MCV7400940.1 AAA family ATPase [Mycobacterium fragae]ORV57084.1 cyclase [Mycobacterium fragae]
MTAVELVCPACGTGLPPRAKFCNECGAAVSTTAAPAEYKQVTVLFADVVHSMDIAAAVGAERLREIMTELVERASVVVRRYGGTVDKFTGDGIMALFGAPVALEDHAFRACLAAQDIQEEAEHLAVELEAKDGIDLQLRVGLNSGEVIAGEIGSGALGYTAVGSHVGMAQRMESVAPQGGVMLSESTARLVEGTAVFGEPQLVHIKGAADPVPARSLVALASRGRIGPHASTLVGRDWELAALTAMLDRSIKGQGCVAGVVGPPGIGKSRIVAETTAIAERRGVQVFSTYCESHTSEIAFHAVTRLLRAVLGTDGHDDDAARAQVRAQLPDADSADLVLLDALLGIRDPAIELPAIAPDARRRRLTALLNTAALARSTTRVYVIEDAHWIDQASEAMLADFLAVIPRTYSLVLVTYRPEYRGALSRTPGAQTIALAPLDDSQTAALIGELLGSHPSITGLANQVRERAAGNPFFAEQIVHDLADRGVLSGERGAYQCLGEVAELEVPATLQAAIAARIDRLDTSAKRTLKAAAVIGLRFGEELLTTLVDNPVVMPLTEAELIDQVMFTPRAEYAFRHPLIRTVAYESQLKSERAELHRRLAAAIEQTDENGPLIAEHLEAAGDLHEAFGWHMRAGTWLRAYRDIGAAWTSWQRARQIADRLPADDPDRTAMRIAPRARLCATTWRAGGSVADAGFDELREMCSAADDKRSLAIGMAGQIAALAGHERHRDASQLSTELAMLLESIADPTLTVALLWTALTPKLSVGEATECVRLAQHMIDLADGDPHMGDLIIETPLILALMVRAAAQACLGQPEWKRELEESATMCRELNPGGRAVLELRCIYGLIQIGLLRLDTPMVQDTAETLKLAEQRGDDYALMAARLLCGLVLAQSDGPERRDGFRLIAMARDAVLENRFLTAALHLIDLASATEKARIGDLDGAIEILRTAVDHEFATGEMIFRGAAITVLVETLLQRGAEADMHEAQAAIERLAAVPVEPGFVLYEIALLRLRALLAKARGDDQSYCDFVERYRTMATSLGFEGHIAMAETM